MFDGMNKLLPTIFLIVILLWGCKNDCKTEYRENGNIKCIVLFDSKQDTSSIINFFDTTAHIVSSVEAINKNKRNGRTILFNENGSISAIKNYKNGFKNGDFFYFYDIDNSIKTFENYRNDTLLLSINYLINNHPILLLTKDTTIQEYYIEDSIINKYKQKLITE